MINETILTTREREVLRLVAAGYTNKQIAELMFVSTHTIKQHLKHIFVKLDVNRRMEAVARAKELKIYERTEAYEKAPEPQNNLPKSLLPLIGRKAEQRELQRYLHDPQIRQVTLCGVGGIGKSHLALTLAWTQLDNFTDGVFFVPLEMIDSAKLLPAIVADSIGFNFSGRRNLETELLDYLQNKHILFIMDACEHIPESAAFIGKILSSTQHIKILATSRTRLHLMGEQLIPIQGINYPDDAQSELYDYDAIKLFQYTAECIQPGYTPDAEQLQQIAMICRYVEGLPLGILIAASWVNILSVGDILEELQANVQQLDIHQAETAIHNQSLEYVFNRSWNMLNEKQQNIMMALATFQGSFSRVAACYVSQSALQEIALLVNKSLLQWDSRHHRYRIHTLFKQYVRAKLDDETKRYNYQTRHFDYFLQLVTAADYAIKQNNNVAHEWDLSIADLRAAMQWGLDHNCCSEVLQFCLEMASYWTSHGYLREERYWLTEGLKAIENPSTTIHGQALLRLARLTWILEGPNAAHEKFQATLALGQRLEDDKLICFSLIHLADTAHVKNEFETSTALYTQGLEVARRLNEQNAILRCLNGLGMSKGHIGEAEIAFQHFEEALDIAKQHAQYVLHGHTLCNMGVLAMQLEEYSRAEKYYRQALDLANEQNFLMLKATVLGNLGEVLYKNAVYEQATNHVIEGILVAHQLGFKIGIAHHLGILAKIEFARGNYQKSACFYGTAANLREQINYPISEPEQEAYQSEIEALKQAMTAAQFQIAYVNGSHLSLEQLIDDLSALHI